MWLDKPNGTRRKSPAGVKRPKKKVDKAVLQRARQALDTMIPRVQQVMQQARGACVPGQHTRGRKTAQRLRAGTPKSSARAKPPSRPQFGKMAKIQEAENQIDTRYEVLEQRPSDSDLLVPAIDENQRQLWCTRDSVVAADAGFGFFSAANETGSGETGRQSRVCPKTFHQERTSQETAKDPLVQDSAEVAHRM